TNVTLTAKSTNGCGTTTAVVPSPTSCPSTNGCTPPALTAGQGVCNGGGTYSVAFSATAGATIAVSPVSATVSGNTVTAPVGTNVTITATLGGCSSVVTVNSPVDCSTACATPAASFSAGACAGATYSVNFVKTSGSVVTASTGTVTGGGSGSTSGTISGVATGTAITATVTEGLCSAQTITISAPSTVAPILTASNAVCSGAGTYSVTFNSNGIVTASAGTVSGNSVTGIPVGTNVTLTATSTNNCATSVAVVTSPVSCPVSNTCTPPALSAGNGVCSGGGFYSVAFSADPGSSVSTSAGIINGNSIDNIPVGTNVVITATAAVGGCTTVLQVNSPSDCSTVCNTTAVSFTRPVSNGATYSVSFSKRSSTVVNSSGGIVTGGTNGSTVGTITGIPVGVNITVTAADPSCSTNSYVISSPVLGLTVNTKVFLQGAMSGSSMTTILRTTISPLTSLPLVPLSQPYSGAPWNYAGTESVGSAAALPANLTDWVLVELRDASSPSTVIATRAAFLLSNGNIVDLDGVSALSFPTVGEGAYYIAIRHRNHMGIRTAAAQYLKTSNQPYDFTTAQVAAYQNGVILSNGGLNNGNAAMKDLGGGIYAMWGGNANSNTTVRYSGPGNDQTPIVNGALGGNATIVLANVYNNADLNLNGVVRSSGPNNDTNVLLNTVLGGNLSLVLSQHL
ncbi:MAG: hypothetical protein NTW29_17540, partial [Bacteroidetes bacterium]|nr:hypothetical protein [Bacteroidota bacterium]